MSLAPDPGAVGEHPIPAALSRIEAALDEVADTNPAYLTPEAKGAALTRLARAESRLTELRLRVLADADDLAATTGARDAAAGTPTPPTPAPRTPAPTTASPAPWTAATPTWPTPWPAGRSTPPRPASSTSP